jgi:RNA polymerase subunit RPABC4/transcription elongation factor Spt4
MHTTVESLLSFKRCDNCGWFNPSSAEFCEKCESDLTGIAPTVQSLSVPAEGQPISVDQNDYPQEKTVESKTTKEKNEEPNVLTETVRMGSSKEKVIVQERNLSYTVLDASHLAEQMDEPEFCPKCRYPLARNIEYCPNCGVTLRRSSKEHVSEPVAPVTKDNASENLKSTVMDWREEQKNTSEQQPARLLKQTVRDIPSKLKDTVEDLKEPSFCLIPIDRRQSPPIPLVPGEIVIIGGERYRFKK